MTTNSDKYSCTYRESLSRASLTRIQVTFDELLALDDGPAVLEDFQTYDDGASSSASAEQSDMRLRGRPTKAKHEGFVSVEGLDFTSSEDELASQKPQQQRLGALRKRNTNSRSTTRSRRETINSSSSGSDQESTKRRRKRKTTQEPIRRSGRSRVIPQTYDDNEDDDEDDDEDEDEDSSGMDILRSDIMGPRKRKRGRPAKATTKTLRTGIRQSDRSTRATNNMQEAREGDIYRSDSEPKRTAPKIINAKEVFQTLPRNNLFRTRHVEGCEVCYEGPNLAPLIYCQGCSLSYHKNCLGNRSGREHLVTKVDEDNYILQCRRCVNVYKKKDSTAPDLSMCQDCHLTGPACKPFRHRKTTMLEQKDRDDNGGLDPIVDVPSNLINVASNVLFRCTKCSRGYHYHHLPPLSQYAMDIARDEDETADERHNEYSKRWLCKECQDTGDQKVSGLVAWRPSDVETYHPGTSCDVLNEDDKQYLIKWEGQSYFRAAWFSGAWTWGVTASAMRKAFFKRDDGPKMRTEDAIPEEFLRIDIVLDIKYTSYVDVRSEEILKARIKEVDKALIKYKGLGYEDAVWEKVPTPEDGDRWLDFVTAYNDWVAGRYVRYPKQGPLRARLEKIRSSPFAKLEKQKQPENLSGGELMKYQIEGLNWLYYQWYSQKNGILADEMGLGKTIQVIAYMATLIEEHNCFPFLVVVPNSTCANWRREIKQWAPSLRVVTFFGSSAARDMASKYEMFPEGSKELRAHIVVTSYDAATDDSCRRIFRGISWAGLIVDEGQRLKNDKSQLYGALNAVKAPFRLLLTGTPLQNNARELFNLLQFLDETIVAAELEEKYAEMTSANIGELHDQIRPFILRRTKAQVLTFLPPLGQIIVPISMSHLQKNLYKSVLAKNPELLKALFTSGNIKQQERASLSNILMQLRKCLCHPFVYSREIEERTDIQAVSHRNLVEASAKLHLLELLLPKLQERGHRVLIFSQFLDMLSIIEDFMDGMQMPYQRLDGTMGSLEKQKRIDQFNAPDSPLFAFLLSTRAGGVGINLATADTVIILDPDFNPHQDIQAISRAHRIGQKNKVLCFQLMTRASVEEKIVQMGRKKMALDHVVVEQLDADDVEDKDVESILKFGAAELFKDDDAEHDIRYDEVAIEKLLDRSQIENTKTSSDDSAESQFSVARVWANNQLADTLDTPEEEVAPNPGVWDKILKERQAAAAAEQLRRANALGRGKRARMVCILTIDYLSHANGLQNVDYATEEKEAADADGAGSITASPHKVEQSHPRKKKKENSEDDTDFQADESEEEEDSAAEIDGGEAHAEADNLKDSDARRRSTSTMQKPLHKNGAGGSNNFSKPPPKLPAITPKSSKKTPATHSRSIQPSTSFIDLTLENSPTDQIAVKPFERTNIPIRPPHDPAYGLQMLPTCPACLKQHPRGACELKAGGVEHCGLCGLAHFGQGRTCPHIKSETQVREMLEALKSSPEKKEHVEAALKYLRGVKGTLVQQKKKNREKLMPGNSSAPTNPSTHVPSTHVPSTQYPYAYGQSGVVGARPSHGQPAQAMHHRVQRTPIPLPSNVPAARANTAGHPVGQVQRPQQQQQQRVQQGSSSSNGHILDDDEAHVESALRGFLGR
jgi:chromodomain-helicase-DNA-binding protein 4